MVSVIIPNYNHAPYFEEKIKSFITISDLLRIRPANIGWINYLKVLTSYLVLKSRIPRLILIVSYRLIKPKIQVSRYLLKIKYT